jgi:hypothetical protein
MQSVVMLLPNANLVRDLSRMSPPTEIRAALQRADDDFSGYPWSSWPGAPVFQVGYGG